MDCLYCHKEWDKRVSIRDTNRERILLGKTNRLEIELRVTNGVGGTSQYTSIDILVCPKCGRFLKEYK